MNHSDDELLPKPSHCSATGSSPISSISLPAPQASANACATRARHTYVIPGTRRTRVAAETLRDWLALYRSGGFDALYPKARTDRGQPRRLPPQVAEQLVSLKTEHPTLSVNALIKTARERGIDHPSRRRPCTGCSRAKDSSTNTPMPPSPPTGAGSPSATPASAGKAMSCTAPRSATGALGERPTSLHSSTMPPGPFPSPPSRTRRTPPPSCPCSKTRSSAAASP